LAIVNVSAFIVILLSQIVSQVSYTITNEIVKKSRESIAKMDDIVDINEMLCQLLIQFYEFESSRTKVITNESQLNGSLTAYLENSLPQYKILSEYNGKEFTIYTPDIAILSKGKVVAVIEIKKEYNFNRLETGYKQVRAYLYESKLKKGILYFYTDKRNSFYITRKQIIDDLEITALIPTQSLIK
jgi:hypothetical protein